ncbi:MAG: hypothetical protein AOA65_1458 [Candidatus Bathyarchaeota archaeon BA1]|nr:MAG: hypothetical protein AOA65_1458 [Candidatus Bathyarchaeota archaeon BA1]
MIGGSPEISSLIQIPQIALRELAQPYDRALIKCFRIDTSSTGSSSLAKGVQGGAHVIYEDDPVQIGADGGP